MLGLLVTLLPESVDGELSRPEGAVPSAAEDGTTTAEDSEAPPDGGAEGPSADESAPTEYYPEEETPAVVEAESSPDDELWWLPDPAEFTGVPGTLYLILDDAGNNLDGLPEFLEFPGPLTVAVLPQLDYSVESAARTAAAGKEIMLHLPMEAVGGANPGPGAVTVGLDESDVVSIVRANLDSVPGAIGVNNHMGSLATADERTMEIVLAELTRRGLFFVDSRTTVATVGRDVAEQLRIPFAERHVFLDNKRSREDILRAMSGALEMAHRQEHVVMIGHATVPELADVLSEIYPTLVNAGYRFGFVSEIVQAPSIAQGDS